MGNLLKENEYITRNNVQWNLNGIAKQLITKIDIYKINDYESYMITPNIYYKYDVWDFNEFNTIGHEKSLYIFDFANINWHYKNFLKNLILKALLIYEIDFSTIKSWYHTAKAFIKYLSKNKIEHLELINEDLLVDYLQNFNHIQARTLQHYKSTLRQFVFEIMSNYPMINFDQVLKTLEVSDKEKEKTKAEQENCRFELIPINYFRLIVSLAIKDINIFMEKISIENELNQSDTYDAISACLIVLLAETGMRIGEAHKLEIDKLKDISPNQVQIKVYYLEFITYKTTLERNGHITQTYMSDIAVLAYNALIKFTENRRRKTNSKYLILTRNGNKYDSPNYFGKLILRFFIKHQEDIGFDSMSKQDLEKFKFKLLNKKSEPWISFNLCDCDKAFYYATAHQFRVTCATRLYQKGKSLDWIMIHMNHMTNTMTQHYIRIAELERNRIHKITHGLMIRASSDGSKLEFSIEEDKDSAVKNELNNNEIKKTYDAMNKFIRRVENQEKRKYNLKVYNDVLNIVEIAVQNNAFITEMELGFCVNSFLKMCENQVYISSSVSKLDDIAPYILDINAIEYNYKRFTEKTKIIKHNEKLAKKDKRFRNEHERECVSMKIFIEKTFLPELELLKNEVIHCGKEAVANKYKGIKSIINKLPKIELEASKWKKIK